MDSVLQYQLLEKVVVNSVFSELIHVVFLAISLVYLLALSVKSIREVPILVPH